MTSSLSLSISSSSQLTTDNSHASENEFCSVLTALLCFMFISQMFVKVLYFKNVDVIVLLCGLLYVVIYLVFILINPHVHDQVETITLECGK